MDKEREITVTQVDNEPSMRTRTPSPDPRRRLSQDLEFPDLNFFKNVLARGQVRSPKRLWYGSWIAALISIIVFSISVACITSYHSTEIQGQLGICSGIFGFIASIGGIAAVLLNRNGKAAYTNLLFYYFIGLCLLSVSVPIVCSITVIGYPYWSTGYVIALLIFSAIYTGVIVFATAQIKDNSRMQYFNFGGAGADVDADRTRMQNRAVFLSRWNEADNGYFNFESPTSINKNLMSEKCLIWMIALYHLMSGLSLIGLGVFNLIKNKAAVVALTFAPFWTGPVTLLCSLIGFMALNRKTNGLFLFFLASNFISFSVSVAFLVFVCVDIDEAIRCQRFPNDYCRDHVNSPENLTFSLTYSGFAVLLLFQLIFSFVGTVLLFYTTCSCCRRTEGTLDTDAPPSNVASSSAFNLAQQRH